MYMVGDVLWVGNAYKVIAYTGRIYEIYSGDTMYLVNGIRHKEDGPAWIERDGYVHWMYHGRCYGHDKEKPEYFPETEE